MAIFDFIKQELKVSGIKTLKELNKPKHKDLRYTLAKRALTRFLETEPTLSKSKALEYIRKETGIKFSNRVGRSYYNELKQIQPKANYASRLKETDKPLVENIPLSTKAKEASKKKGFTPQEEYLYIFDVYITIRPITKRYKRYKLKPLPKNAMRINDGKYLVKEPYVFYSEILFNKRDVYKIGEAIFTGKASDYDDYIQGSDHSEILNNRNKVIIGFKYSYLVRN